MKSKNLEKDSLKSRIGLALYKYKYIYILLIPIVAYVIIFSYFPLYGAQLAFKEYNASKGIWGSEWIGLANFRRMFTEAGFLNALKNTVTISLINLFGGCLWPPILAILFSELRMTKYKRVLQVTYTFPHFLNWVILSGIIYSMFGSEGIVNAALNALGFEDQNLLTNPGTFRIFLLVTGVWKSAGWSSIMYIAIITAIDKNLYEASALDGASRIQRIWYVTIPEIAPIFSLGFIMAFGGLLSGNFEQIFNLYNSTLYEVADTIDTYLYRISFMQEPSYGYSTAVGFTNSVVSCILMFSFNALQKRLGGTGMFEGGVRG
ncbi:MAG: sugar ABC transporter permease [Clostridia bacterium]|nr:sugar ABC transporter permease [Clostridia bacterium]